MAGAHFDSWIAGDGANDNGAGSVAVIEAARLLAKLGIKPGTIRFALWAGEEQGLLGSRAYIDQHFVSRPVDPSLTGLAVYAAWRNAYPITPKAEYKDLKAYFNMDNGSGRFRGIYAEGNVGAGTLLGDWLALSAAWGRARWWPPKPAAPTMCSCRRWACRATSSFRTRWITAAASTIPASTRWTTCAPTTCARPA
jgi:Zn-dependent M28 family amino/carboxypeptidase